MRHAQPQPQDVIRRYLDSHQGLVTVLAEDLATSWQLEELKTRDRRRIGKLLNGAGVHTDPVLAEAEDGDLVTLFLPGSDLAAPVRHSLDGAAAAAGLDGDTAQSVPERASGRSPLAGVQWRRPRAPAQGARESAPRAALARTRLSERVRGAASATPRVPALIAVLVALAAGAGTYAVGAAGGEDIESARAAGERAGRSAGETSGRKSGYEAGLASGRKQGYRQTYRPSFVRACRTAVDQAETVISPEEACK